MRALVVFDHHSPEEILAHPRFPVARARFVEALLALCEGDAFLSRVLGEAARQVTFNMIVCLDAGSEPDDPATWPTLAHLKQQMAQFGLASARRIESLVTLLAHQGFLDSIPSQRDARRRLLTPTAKMLSTDRAWLAANHAPLQAMFTEHDYGAVMQRDPAFHRLLRRVTMGSLGRGARILRGNPEMMLFLQRDAGILILLQLVQAARPDGSEVRVHYRELGARFGVSKTHVQKVLQDAARAGLVRVAGEGRRYVMLTPAIWHALDRFIAEAMSVRALIFNIARHQMNTVAREFDP